MNRVKHTKANAPIMRIETLSDARGQMVVLDMQASAASEADRALAALGTRVLCDVTHEKNHTRIYRSTTEPLPSLEQIAQALGGGFIADEAQKREAAHGFADLNRWRGIFGTFGQIMQQFAGYREQNPVLNQSSAISMASNLITVAYGTQNRIDSAKTERLRHKADVLLTRSDSDYHAPSDAEVKAPEQALSDGAKLNRYVQSNNMIISDAMKFGSQVFLSARGNNWVDRTMGHLQWSSKLVTFAGIDKDTDTNESQKSLLTKLRERSNIISGIMEWAGQAFNMFNAIYLPQIHSGSFDAVKKDFTKHGIKAVKQHYRPLGEVMQRSQWKHFRPSDIHILSPMRFMAVCAFATGFVVKTFAPFSSKDVNWDELQHHATLALQNIPPEKRDAALAQMSALYQHAMGDEGLRFADIYKHLHSALAAQPKERPITGAHTAALREQRAQIQAAPATRIAG